MRAPLGKRIAVATLGVLVSLSATAWAMGYRGGKEHDPGRMLTHMAERLELTEDQRAEVRTIVDNGREQTAADRGRLEELRGQLMNMRGEFDPGEAQKIADEIGEITSRMVYQFARSHARFYSVLTDEQKAEMEQLKEEHGERRGRWHKQAREQRD